LGWLYPLALCVSSGDRAIFFHCKQLTKILSPPIPASEINTLLALGYSEFTKKILIDPADDIFFLVRNGINVINGVDQR
jgi:hypothetical protein